ncbi:13519_t:CDS:2, partial [Funneliformis mosseae]
MSIKKVEEIITEQSSNEYLSHYDTNLYSTLHVVISPNGQQVTTFNTITLELNMGKSLAISNPIDQVDNEDMHAKTLIALSCFDEKDMMLRKLLSLIASLTYQHQLRTSSGKDGKIEFHHSSYERKVRIYTEVDEFGGLVRFLDDDPLDPYTATILVQAELKKLYQNTLCLELLSRSIENDYFIIENYKDKMQVVEMYNMRTNQLEMVFHQRAESVATLFGHSSSAVAISRHKTLLAYCRDNAIKVLRDIKKLFPFQQYRLVRNCGTILLIDNSDGSVIPILNDSFIKNILVPSFISKRELIELRLQYLHNSEEYFDADSELEKSSIIVNNMELWVHNKNYGHISAFLDNEKITQLFIRKTTLQVWYRKNKRSKKRLKYIWVILMKDILIIKSLEIGKREFKVTLSSQSTQSYQRNTINDACSAFRYLYEKRDNPTASLVYSRHINLVQQILNTKDSDFSIRYLHTSCLYEWPKKPKKSDLETAIKCSEGRQRDVVMIGFFLDYYSDNAIDNTSWMFTVFRAIPLLFENRL